MTTKRKTTRVKWEATYASAVVAGISIRIQKIRPRWWRICVGHVAWDGASTAATAMRRAEAAARRLAKGAR